jgi:hypothetical protein
MKRVISFLFGTKDPEDEKIKQQISQSFEIQSFEKINNEHQFIRHFMCWTTASMFGSDRSNWFIDEHYRLNVTTLGLNFGINSRKMLSVIPTHRDFQLKTKNDRIEFKEISDRLTQCALKFAEYLKFKTGETELNKLDLFSICIIVSEITEEISFIFHPDQKAMEIFHTAIVLANRSGYKFLI